MEDEDQNAGTSVAAALAGLSAQYTTPEAQAIAKRTFDELYNERGEFNAQEQEQLRQLDATAQSAKDALKAARDKLLSQRYNEQAKWFALAGTLGQGSKSGRFGEELGRVGNVLSEHSVAKRKFSDDRDLGALKLQLEAGTIDENLVKAKLAAIKARRDADKSLMEESLKVMGREIRPGRGTGAANMSPFGKIAADEGLAPGTPAFTARVKELYGIDLKQKQQASGVDVEAENPDDTRILAQNYGVPISPVDPFRGLSTKARQAAVQRSMEAGNRALTTLSEADATAQGAIRQIDRFMALNEKQASGPVYGLPLISWFTGMSAAAQEMDQIRADIARKQRQPGEGQVSNFDATQFLVASPGRGKSYQVNKNIALGIKTAKQLQLEQSDFLRNYLAVNRHLTGAKEAWKKYLEANPIFDPKAKQGSFDLNLNRVDYQSYFRLRQAQEVFKQENAEPAAGAPVDDAAFAPATVDDELAQMTPQERAAALRPALAKGGRVKPGYAGGGRVEALKALIKAAEERTRTAYTAAPAPRLPPVPANSALQQIAARKEALLRAIAGNGSVTPLDASQMQATSSVLDTVLANASKNTDANAGLRAEALWRQLQDMASKYKGMAGGGKVSGARGLIDRIVHRLEALNQKLQTMDEDDYGSPESIALAAERDRLWEHYQKAAKSEEDTGTQMADGGQVDAQERGRRALIAQIAREMAQGATYNFSDEMLGGSDAGLRDERAALEEFGNDNPLSALALQGAGAVPTGMAAGAAGHKLMNLMKGSGPTFHPKLGMKKGKAAGLASLIERVMPKSAVGKMILSGGASGAVAGAGASQGDRGSDALTQGTVGSILGPLGGLSSKYGLGIGRRATDAVRGTTPRAADEKVLAALGKDVPNPDDVVKRLTADAKAGIPATIGDSAGKNTSALMEAVAGKSGRGPSELAEKLEKRQLEQGARVEDKLNRALKPSEYFAELDKLKDELYTNAKPLYEAAYTKAKPVPLAAVDFLYDSKAGTRAMKDAVELMNVRGVPIGRKDFFGKVNNLSVQSLDYVKQALDDAISKEEGKGANYVATTRGSGLRSLRNRLRDVLDNHSPDYKAARAQYAGDLEVLDALRTGREQFVKMTPKQIENLVADMSFAEKDAYRTGVAQTLFEAISKSPRGSNVAAKVVGTPALTAKLAPLFDKPKDAAAFNEAMLRELQLHKGSAGAISNAARQRAGSAAAGLDESPLADAADFALDAGQQAVFLPGLGQNTGGPYTTARIMQWVRNRLPMSEQTANDAADMLGVDNPKEAKKVIERLKAEGARLKKRAAVSDAVARAGTRATAVATAPDPWAQMEEGAQ